MTIEDRHYNVIFSYVKLIHDRHPNSLRKYIKSGLSENRFVWDVLHGARIEGDTCRWLHNNVYTYATKTQVEGAVAKMVHDLWGPTEEPPTPKGNHNDGIEEKSTEQDPKIIEQG